MGGMKRRFRENGLRVSELYDKWCATELRMKDVSAALRSADFRLASVEVVLGAHHELVPEHGSDAPGVTMLRVLSLLERVEALERRREALEGRFPKCWACGGDGSFGFDGVGIPCTECGLVGAPASPPHVVAFPLGGAGGVAEKPEAPRGPWSIGAVVAAARYECANCVGTGRVPREPNTGSPATRRCSACQGTGRSDGTSKAAHPGRALYECLDCGGSGGSEERVCTHCSANWYVSAGPVHKLCADCASHAPIPFCVLCRRVIPAEPAPVDPQCVT